jgi:hypothetical protein
MEILSEKAERMQAKKEVEILKEIEECVRKEIKASLTPSLPLSHSPPNSITNIHHSKQSSFSGVNGNDESTPSAQMQQYDPQGPSSSDYKRGSIIIDESVCNSGRSDLYRGSPMGGLGGVSEALLEKWSDKMRGF